MVLDALLAYIDPASGTILLQLVIGFFVGAGIYFRERVGRLFRAFKRS